MTKLCRTFLLSPSCRHIWKRKPPSDVPVTSLSDSFVTARDRCSWLLGRPQLWDIFAFSSTIIRFLEHLAIMGLAAYMIRALRFIARSTEYQGGALLHPKDVPCCERTSKVYRHTTKSPIICSKWHQSWHHMVLDSIVFCQTRIVVHMV